MTGKVVTFYSYKGGVGRSFALANVAALLARWQFKVLCIDWDIEAPGLDHYFRTADWQMPGLVDMLVGWPMDGLPWHKFVNKDLELAPGIEISLLAAGLQDRFYTRRAQKLNWASMYRRGLGEALETMIAEMREQYDFVLIDSRTGITDFGAIVTAQLPDILAFMFTANRQSLEGCIEVAEKAQIVRKSLPIDRGPLRLLPIVARFEGRVEYSTSQAWRERFYESLKTFYSSWLVQRVDHRRILDQTTIPHVPFWTFGEELAVLREASGGYPPDSISYTIETIAALIAKDLAATEVLAESRDLYVNELQRREDRRRSGVANVYVSFAQNDRRLGKALLGALERAGLSCLGSDFVQGTEGYENSSLKLINRAQHMLVLVGREYGQWQSAEVRAFRSQSALDERPRHLVPVLTEPDVRVPQTLLSYKALEFIDDVEDIARFVVSIVGSGPAAA